MRYPHRDIDSCFKNPHTHTQIDHHHNYQHRHLCHHHESNHHRNRIFLELIQLPGYENRRVDELSGGEAQRLALGRSIVAEPRFLLLDEPFSSPDETLRKKLLQDTIELLEQRKIGSILVTHNHEEAKLFSENSILLED